MQIARHLGLKESVPLGGLHELIHPVLVIGDLTREDAADVLPLRRPYSSGFAITSIAGQQPRHQLLNPAASGIIAIVTSIIASCDVSGKVDIGRLDTALPTPAGGSNVPSIINTRSTVSGSIQGTAPAAPACQHRTDTGGAVGVQGTNLWRSVSLNAGSNGFYEWKLDTPIVLGEGTGIVVDLQVLATRLVAGWQWFEVGKSPHA